MTEILSMTTVKSVVRSDFLRAGSDSRTGGMVDALAWGKILGDREWQRWDLLSTQETLFVPLLYLDWPISTSVVPVEEWRLMSQLHTDVVRCS